MRSSILVGISMLFSIATADCSGDNCANHVTGSWPGIGVPVESRISMCNSFLRTTIKPAATTVTSTITKFTTDPVAVVPSASTSAAFTTSNTTLTTTITRIGNETLVPSAVPTFASAHCSSPGEFSSACSCWANVTGGTTTLPTPTVTATTTITANIGCAPAATGVVAAPGTGSSSSGNGTHFPCSRQWGTCSCLFSGEDEVCVRVGPFFGGPGGGNLTSGPCEAAKECDARGGCEDEGHVCVFDGSCGCGKRRCYRAARDGCEYQGLPMEEAFEMKKVE